MHCFRKDKIVLAAALVLSAMAPLSSYAQDTTSAIRGRISNVTGEPVAGATVIVSDSRTGTSTTLNTGDSGRFNASGLRVGGPYSVKVVAPNGEESVRNDVYLVLGDSYALEMVLGDSVNLESMTVVSAALSVPNTAIGPSATFNVSDLENAPSVNRDLKDALRFDPRIYIDDSNGSAVQCGGANPRFNSLTVDGVRLNDNFGLNGSGYPTERMPFSYDVIDQVSVELAPFDVNYGGFSACNINAVTKSGTNEFHGSVFYDYTNDSMRGDSLNGKDVDLGTYEEKRYGFTVGGPILKDKLFFLASYEGLEGANTFFRDVAGSGAADEVAGLSQADLERIISISETLYDYNPGGIPSQIPNEDEKILVKLDYYITAGQRAAFTYNYNDGYNVVESDSGNTRFEFDKHLYERGNKLEAYVGQLFSDWTSDFSTVAKVSYSELTNRQISQGGTDVGEVQINVSQPDPVEPQTTRRAVVFLGSDDSRHANKMNYNTTGLKLGGEYHLGSLFNASHLLSGGIEYDLFDVFNIFIQEAEGEFAFSSIDNFEAGKYSSVIYENAAGTNNPNDAAAQFQYGILTYYVQDEFVLDSLPLTVTAGLRYDTYQSSDLPVLNQTFTDVYGFSNQQNVDGLALLQPRLGFNWAVNGNLEVHGGVGLFSGGNPNVWISNNYSNNGVSQIENRLSQDPSSATAVSLFDLNNVADEGGLGRPLYGIPEELFNLVEAGTGRTGGINTMDPNFEVPSEWKFAIGTQYFAPYEMRFNVDYLYTDKKDAAIIRDISRVQAVEGGAAPRYTADGRPIYVSANGRSQDFMLTNVHGDAGYSQVLSMSVDQSLESGFSWALAYAYTISKDVNPMTSSVAFSNYINLATADSENPGVATSNYEIPHRFTLKLEYERAFFGDYDTQVTLFSQYNEGRPYSFVFDNLETSVGDTTGSDRQLFYMPTSENDPNVVFAETFNTAAFFEYAAQRGLNEYKGKTVPRNAFYSDWWFKMDFKLEQEFPGIFNGNKASAFVVVDNLTNLLNDEWGIQKQSAFPQVVRVVDASVNADGTYQFKNFLGPNTQSIYGDSSLYEIRVGVKYKF